jgi:hypothetical protein
VSPYRPDGPPIADLTLRGLVMEYRRAIREHEEAKAAHQESLLSGKVRWNSELMWQRSGEVGAKAAARNMIERAVLAKVLEEFPE